MKLDEKLYNGSAIGLSSYQIKQNRKKLYIDTLRQMLFKYTTLFGIMPLFFYKIDENNTFYYASVPGAYSKTCLLRCRDKLVY